MKGAANHCRTCKKAIIHGRPSWRRRAKYCSKKCVPGHKHKPEIRRRISRKLREWADKHPEEHRINAIRNLPKDCLGSKNGNWRGGKSRLRQEWRNKLGSELTAQRKRVHGRDKVCKDCGSANRLEVHHIVSCAQCPKLILLDMNTVLLCHSCHRKTDSYCGRNRPKVIEGTGSFTCIIQSIPHRWQAYPTVGNWAWMDGILLIFVSKMPNEDSEIAVALHEMIEAVACRRASITDQAVTDFDLLFEKERSAGLHNEDAEPGDDRRAPYFQQHQNATFMERYLCGALGISWEYHEKAVQAAC